MFKIINTLLKYFKMKHTLLLFFLLTNCISIAQIQRDHTASYALPEFISNEPMWHYTVYDSTIIGFPIERLAERFTDGYNAITYIRPWNWKPIIDGQYMYGYSTSFGTTSHIYGAIVYKIDLQTGELVWQTVFDNRQNDRQEYVQSIEIKNNAVELITLRRLKSHTSDIVPLTYNLFGADSYVCKRVYNMNDGQLIDYNCWDKDDPNTATVAPHSEGNRILYQNNDNDFLYLENKAVNSRQLVLSKFDTNGKLNYNRIDTMYYPKDNYPDYSKLNHTSSGGKMAFLETDTILVAYNYDFSDGVTRAVKPDLCYIQMYDKRLNPIGRLSTGKFVEMYNDAYNILIRYASPKYLVLYINRTNTNNYIVCDYEMNILSNSEFVQDDNSLVIGYGMLEYSNKPIMITKTYGSVYPRDIPQSLSYYIYENGNWQTKFTQEMGENHYLDEIKYLSETPDHNLILCADHAFYDGDLDLSCYETDMWMLIDGHKLGIKTSTKDISIKNNQLKIHPNPTNSIIHIQGLQEEAKVNIQDINGQGIKAVVTSDGQVDISELPNGLYIFEIKNKQVIERHKVLKIE